MQLRQIELIIPQSRRADAEDLIKNRKEVLSISVQPITATQRSSKDWEHELFLRDLFLIRILLPAEGSEGLLDLLQTQFSLEEGYRINIFPVEATLPRPEEPKAPEEPPEEAQEKGAGEASIEKEKENIRISREELYEDVEAAAKFTTIYMVMIVLSSIVAAIGILNNNVAVIIGAMVMAPLLGPNVALSLATTLGDLSLARNALKANIAGIGIAVLLSLVMGSMLLVDPSTPEIQSRTSVGLKDIILALASGCAGALSFTSAAPAALIGVAVAVALLPPLVTFGLLLGSGHTVLAFGALLLFIMNIICVNLAGVATFVAQGISPRTWWAAERARMSTIIAISLWVLLLVVLLALSIIYRGVRISWI
jgi:uncharacterized hydrophobic protein (TIGR00341 family)